MRWFKHYSDNHRGITIQTAFDKVGWAAYSVYVIMELCAEKLDKRHLESSEDGCTFTFSRVYFQNILRMKSKQTELVLALFSELNWLQATVTKNEIIIKMPILLNLLDGEIKRPRRTHGKPVEKPRLELELELDKDNKEIYKEKILNFPESSNSKKFENRFKFNFQELFDLYPRNFKKTRSLDLMAERIHDLETFNQLKTAIQNYRQYCETAGTEYSFIMGFPAFFDEWRDWIDAENGKSKINSEEATRARIMAMKFGDE